MRKWLYLCSWAFLVKSKGTLFSPTLKVGENKVSLVFLVMAQGLSYDQFLTRNLHKIMDICINRHIFAF